MGARTSPCRPQSTLFRLSVPASHPAHPHSQSAGPAMCMQASCHSARLAAAQQHAAGQDEGFAWIGPFGNQRRYSYIPSGSPPLDKRKMQQGCVTQILARGVACEMLGDRHLDAHRYLRDSVIHSMCRIHVCMCGEVFCTSPGCPRKVPPAWCSVFRSKIPNT